MEIVFRQGVEWCRNGDYRKGIELFDQVIAVQPAHEASLYNRAKARAKLNLLEEALADFNQLIHLFPSKAAYFSDRGVLYYHLDQSDKAIQDLDMACDLEPDKPYRYASRAYLKDQMRDLQGALADYKTAIKLDPEDAVSLNNMGLVEQKLGRLEQAKKSFERADVLSGIDHASYPSPPTPENDLSLSSKTENDKSHVQDPKKRLNLATYLVTLKKLLVSKKERKAFLEFIFNLLTFKSK